VLGVTSVAAGPRQASKVTSTAAEVGYDPTVVMELVTNQLMGCRLGGTSGEHPQYYLPKVLIQPSFSSPILLPIMLCRYPLVQSRHSRHKTKLSDPAVGGSVPF
jgi:hypothetical protein